MKAFWVYAVILAMAIRLSGAQEVAPFRQYIEAEDCSLTKLRTHRNPLGGYIGDRFAYNIFKQPDSGKLSAPLRAKIPPGSVKVFVRAYCGDGPPRSRVMTVRIGGAEASLEYPDKPFANKHNWLPFLLNATTPADDIEIEVRAIQGGRVIVDSILISNDPDDSAYSEKGRTRLAQRRTPTPPRARRAEEGNMLVNPGFEVAPTNGWRSGYQSQWALTEQLYDAANPYEGERCLRVTLMRNKRSPLVPYWQTYDGVYSAPMQLERGATYSASIFLRADGPISGVIGLKGATKRFKLDDAAEWRRVSATVQAKADTDCFYVSLRANGPRTVWLDAAQLERGEMTDYSPGDCIAVGVFCGRAGRVWREGDDVKLTWEMRGGGEAGRPVTVRYQIHDALGRIMRRDSFTAEAPRGRIERIPLHEGLHPTGAYRVAYTVEAPNVLPYSGQICYSVIPKARAGGDGPIGLYASHSRQCFAAMANAGIHWTNTLSSAGHFAEWTYVEPERGRYVFHDEDIAVAKEFGVHILANINTNRSSMPKWVMRDSPGEGEWIKHPMGYFKLADWERFVFALVEHYRDDVKHWLILDEPDVGTNRYSPEDYAKLLRSAYRAAKRADPDCVVFAHTGTSKGWRERVLALAGPEFFDAQYTYVGRFNCQVGDRLHAEAERLKRPLWTVDFAPVRQLSMPYAAIVTDGVPSWDATAANTRKYDIWAIRSLSWGRAEKWFRYDARYPGPPPGVSYMSIWEHDGALTPHGVSIAAMNALIADARPQGEATMPDGMEGHLFVADDRKLLVAWTTDGAVRSLGMKAAAWDVYGGRLETPLVGALPTFVEFRGEKLAWKAPVVEWIEAEMLEPESDGQPYRARFIVHARGPASGEWVAEGPYFLRREAAQRISCTIGKDGKAELILPLNVWPNLPLRGREVQVKLYLPGRSLSGNLSIETESKQM